MNYTFYELIWIFVIYAFFGWCIEVIVATIQNRRFINRGFLNGPFCPIYGFAVLAVILLLLPVSDNLLIFFISSMILVSVIEFFTGFILEKSFEQKWWDYNDRPLNLYGYVCLQTSVIWGVACVVVIYAIQPFIGNFITSLSGGFGVALIAFVILLLIVDTAVTISSLLKIKRRNQLLNDIGNRIESLSVTLGKGISDDVIVAMKIADNKSQEIENLRRVYSNILSEKIFGHSRLSKAFPKLDLLMPKKTRRRRTKTK